METNSIVQIGTIIIALIGAIITYIIVPYVKARTTKQQQENIAFWVRVAVNAAEQLFGDPGMGKKKKEYVLDFLEKMGFKITMDELNILIEAAVLELNKIKG